jgi:hypothetical protein
MTLRKLLNILIKLVCKKEKGKVQVSAGNVREIMRILAEQQCEADYYCTQGPVDVLNDYAFKVRKKVWKRLEKLEVEK